MYIVMPLAVLITFGLMQRSNEITAMKATGTSIYPDSRAVLLSASMVAEDCFSLSSSICRMQIKGRMRYET